jgi:hypothetical protein
MIQLHGEHQLRELLETRRPIITLLNTVQFDVDIERLLFLNSLHMQKRNTPIRIVVLQLFPIILWSPDVTDSLLTDGFRTNGWSLAVPFRAALAVLVAEKVSERRDRRGYASNTGFNIRAEHGVGNPNCFELVSRRCNDVVEGGATYMADRPWPRTCSHMEF